MSKTPAPARSTRGAGQVARPIRTATQPPPPGARTSPDRRDAPHSGVPVPKPRPIKVRATRIGYYDHVRRREGDVFVIANAQAFSETWMEAVSPDEAERVTTIKDAQRAEHDRILAEKYPGPSGTGGATGDRDVLG